MFVSANAKNTDAEIEKMVEEKLAQLTLDEKLSLVYGDGVRYNNPLVKIGLPKLLMCAGPRGVAHYWTRGEEATSFPSGTGMAAAWDPELAGLMAEAIAREGASLGVDVMLMPGLNINRDPLGGRTFERYTEDPFLNGKLVVPQVKAVQEKVGLASTITLYVCNNQETERDEVDVIVSERALREIYLPGFKAAVQEGKPWALMTGTNKVNGEHVSSSKFLMTDILRDEWGFDGVTMTDWADAKSTVADALAGLDLSMPGRKGNKFAEPLAAAVKAGKVPESVIDEKVRRLLRMAARVNRFPGQKHDVQPRPLLDPEHVALARRIAEEGIVLLKNEDALLPFDPAKVRTLAVFGPNADYVHNVQRLGGGSSGVHCPEAEVTPLEGLRNLLGENTKILWDPAYSRLPITDFEPLGGEYLQTTDGNPGLNAEYFNNPELKGKPSLSRVDTDLNHLWDMKSPDENIINADNFSGRWTGYLIPPSDGQYTFLVQYDDGVRITIDDKVVFPRWGARGFNELQFSTVLKKGHKHKLLVEYREAAGDATLKINWKRPISGDALAAQMARVSETAKSADACIFFAGLNTIIESEGHDRKEMFLTPLQAEMIETVIRANPNTAVVVISGSPVDMRGWGDEARAILQAWYGGVEAGNAIANVLFGKVNPGGKLPITIPKKLEDNPAYREGGIPTVRNEYTEGILVGYRWYDAKNIEPMYPFGHGLSYTTFAYENLALSKAETPDGPVVTVSFDVKNTGPRAGTEIAQIYVADKEASVLRPPRELKGFEKLRLEPGETKRATVELPASAFQFWDENTKAWKLEPGEFGIDVGSSSRDIRLTKSVSL